MTRHRHDLHIYHSLDAHGFTDIWDMKRCMGINRAKDLVIDYALNPSSGLQRELRAMKLQERSRSIEFEKGLTR